MTEMFDQLQKGLNFEKAEELLGGISTEMASQAIPGAPYTILQNLAHTEVWQRFLLGERGTEPPSHEEEWASPDPNDWEALRSAFLEGWKRAGQRAGGDVDDVARTKLLHVALHGTYHLGQIALLRRMLEKAPK